MSTLRRTCCADLPPPTSCARHGVDLFNCPAPSDIRRRPAPTNCPTPSNISSTSGTARLPCPVYHFVDARPRPPALILTTIKDQSSRINPQPLAASAERNSAEISATDTATVAAAGAATTYRVGARGPNTVSGPYRGPATSHSLHPYAAPTPHPPQNFC